MKRLYRFLAAIAGGYACVRVGLALRHLLFPAVSNDAGDLLLRWNEVHEWFRGARFYGKVESADYPPASYPLLWPFTGWVDEAAARWIWACVTLALVAWLARRVARESIGAPAPLRFGVVASLVAGYATFSTIANGQVGIMVLTALLAGTLILARSRTLQDDLAGSALVIASLVKPTLSVPLVWIAFLVPRRVRPAAMIVGGYVALTLVAAAFRTEGVIELVRGWLGQRGSVNYTAGGPNLQLWASAVGLEDLFLPAALVLCLGTGVWVWRHRDADVWLLLGVTAIVALFWTYHRPFDDVLMLLPMVALVRTAGRADGGRRRLAIALAWGMVLLSLEYPQLRYRTHGLLVTEIETLVLGTANLRLGVWLATLILLVIEARRAVSPSPAAVPVSGSAASAAVRDASDESATADSAIQPRGLPSLHSRSWLPVCFAVPILMLVGAYVWLAIDHRSAGLMRVVVHENGRYTLAETIFYFRHFLREIPTIIGMALFLVATVGIPPGFRMDRVRRLRARTAGLATLAAAGLLVVLSIFVVAASHGLGEAMRNLMQAYTRDDVLGYGSHWRFHWLSTLWFGLAAPFAASIGARIFGARAPANPGVSGIRRAAWIYFLVLTILFGVSLEPFIDARFIGHQAREILTHALITLPLGLGLIGVFCSRACVEGQAMAHRLSWATRFGVFAMPAYLGIGVIAFDSMAAGQTGGGLAAMIGAHFFEHTLDYVMLGLLVIGGMSLRLAHVPEAEGS